jgi:formylglycine-generating enzyme required for sulfatase activity
MKTRFYKILSVVFLSAIISSVSVSQRLIFDNENKGLIKEVFDQQYLMHTLKQPVPLFSFDLQKERINPSVNAVKFADDVNMFTYKMLEVSVSYDSSFNQGIRFDLLFKNIGNDTVILENIVPFGTTATDVYITATGPWNLARTKIYIKGKEPLGVILPDNAWEMGYGAINITEDFSLCAIARRKEIVNGLKKRYESHLSPGGSVKYQVYIQEYDGEWQNGLKKMFHENYLFDLEEFNDSLYRRKDLQWIRSQYLMTLQFAWNHEFYDEGRGGYLLDELLEEGMTLCGGFDVFGLWPTWPTLGLDERNQWDLYRDMPGGLPHLKQLSQSAKEKGTKFFISYNPWDQSTRKENHYQGMAGLIKAIDADGVILDCHGNSSFELQAAADSVKSGVIMYSEGMAVPADMPGIIAGRVHDAIFMPPPLNLNKLIRPDFAIFRVCQLSQGRIHREVAISLFNGYGIELNMFAPGRPEWIADELKYLGKAVKILRENTSCFTGSEFTPLKTTLKDNIWVNEFRGAGKTIYTVFSLTPEGFSGPLFEVKQSAKHHFVSLWHHEELKVEKVNGKQLIHARTESFDKAYLGSRQEGNADCIAMLEKLISVSQNGQYLTLKAEKGDRLLICAGEPDYGKVFREYKPGEHRLNLYELFGVYEGKFVIQLMKEEELMDEGVVYLTPGTPKFISKIYKTTTPEKVPQGMVEIASGSFSFNMKMDDQFIPYPAYDSAEVIQIKKFYMDKYPVTNNQFYDFIESTGYTPKDKTNFLKNWDEGKYPMGMKNFPVVYISYEDAQAYANWSGKRLPTEAEWQYAAQTSDGRLYPWGNTMDSTKCNFRTNKMTPVNQFPDGSNPFGLEDLVGNVWQITNDIYDNGSQYFIMIRGGSYYYPTSSWWYVKGGPQPLNKTQMLLRVSPGFERNATVGFRCMMDAK